MCNSKCRMASASLTSRAAAPGIATPRIAVCYAGQVRAATCKFSRSAPGRHSTLTALDSIATNLIAPLEAHARVDVFASLDAPPRKNQLLPGRMVATLQRIFEVLKPVAGVLTDEGEVGPASRRCSCSCFYSSCCWLTRVLFP